MVNRGMVNRDMVSGAASESGPCLHVRVVYALPELQVSVAVALPEGACVVDALAAVATREPFAGLDLASVPVGVFGEQVSRSTPLRDGDRVELYRPLLIDPRDARRRRTRGG